MRGRKKQQANTLPQTSREGSVPENKTLQEFTSNIEVEILSCFLVAQDFAYEHS